MTTGQALSSIPLIFYCPREVYPGSALLPQGRIFCDFTRIKRSEFLQLCHNLLSGMCFFISIFHFFFAVLYIIEMIKVLDFPDNFTLSIQSHFVKVMFETPFASRKSYCYSGYYKACTWRLHRLFSLQG